MSIYSDVIGLEHRVVAEHVLRKIRHCTFRSQKLDSNFWTTLFTKKCLFIQPNFRMTVFVTAHADSLSSLHISIHHYTFCASLHVKTGPEPIPSDVFEPLNAKIIF